MKDKYLLSLFGLLLVVIIMLFVQICFLLERPKKSLERKNMSLILENNKLKEKIKGLLLSRKGLAREISSLIEKEKVMEEKMKEILKKPKIIEDPHLRKSILELSRENEYRRKIKEMDNIIKKANDDLLMKEEKIEALKVEIENKEKEKDLIMDEIKDAWNDPESKERIKSLEEEQIALASRILSLQDEIGELSKKKDELSFKNELILKEKDALLEKLVFIEEQKERTIKEKEEQIEEISKKKDEEIAKIIALRENDKKLAGKKSITGNLLSMFLLWKR